MTLRWPPLPGPPRTTAVYRGDLSALRIDADHDGVPDFGYGLCVSGNDPNRTDTIFVDQDRPHPGNGFFYLKGIIDEGVVRGLGTTSDGFPREVQQQCP